MTQKNTGRHAPDNSTAAAKNTTGRRKLLKAALVGGGAITTAKHLPDQWSAPVIDSVLLPAHAETSSGPVTGVFSIVDITLEGITRAPDLNGGAQFALLDSLISPASAVAVPVGVCNIGYSAAAIFRINANNSVDVAVEIFGGNDAFNIYCGASTTYHPGTGKIDDVSVTLQFDDTIHFTNLSANTAAVKGNWELDSNPVCEDTFTAPLGGAFPNTDVCGNSA